MSIRTCSTSEPCDRAAAIIRIGREAAQLLHPRFEVRSSETGGPAADLLSTEAAEPRPLGASRLPHLWEAQRREGLPQTC